MGDTQTKITIDVDGEPAKSALGDVASFIGGVGAAAQQASEDSKSAFDRLWDEVKEKGAETGEALKQVFENPVAGIEALGGVLKDVVIDTLSEIGGVAATAATGLAGVAAIGGVVGGTLFGLADHAAHAGEEIEAFSIKSGMAAENVGPLDLAAKAAGGSLDTLSTILRQVDMKGAADAGGKFTAALADMGINAAKFKNEDFGAQVADLSAGLQVAGEKGNAMSDALAIGGRGMSNNIAFLEKLNPDLLDVAKSMSMVWTPELLEQSRQFSVDMGLFEGALGQIATRIGAELLPVMSGLLDVFVKSPSFINGVVAAADALGHGLGYVTIGVGALIDGFAHLAAPVVAITTFLGTLIVDGFEGIYNWTAKVINGFQQWVASSSALGAIGSVFTDLRNIVTTVVDWIVMKLESIPIVGSSIKQAFDNAAAAFNATAGAGTTVADVSDRLGASLLAMGQQTTTAAGAHENLKNRIGDGKTALTDFEKAMEDLNTAGKDYHATILGIDGETVNAVEYYLQAGISANTLKTIYELTEVQIKALEAEYKNYENTLKSVRAIEESKNASNLEGLQKLGAAQATENKRAMDDTVKSINQTEKLWHEYYATIGNSAKSATQLKIDEVTRWKLDEEAKLKEDDANWQQHYDAIEAVAAVKIQNIVDDTSEGFKDIKKLLSDLDGGPGGFADTFAHTLVKTGSFSQSFVGFFQQAKTDLEKIAGDMLSSMINGFLKPLLDNVTSVASSISRMLLGALTGQGGGGGFGGFLSGLAGNSSSTGNYGGLVTGALGSLFSSGGAYGAISASIAASEASTVAAASSIGAGLTAGAGGSVAAGGASTAAAGGGIMGGLGTAATFLATNPIGWAIDAGIGALALWNHFSGPSDQELAGRAAVNQWATDVWQKLSPDQQKQASSAGWSDPKQAGIMVWMDTLYANMGRPNPSQSASNFYKNMIDAIPKGHSGVVSAIQDVQSFDLGGTVQGPAGSPQAVIAHAGETYRTPAQEQALAGQLVDHLKSLRDEIKGYHDAIKTVFTMQPIQMKHAMRGAR
jgi:hypothetical protein